MRLIWLKYGLLHPVDFGGRIRTYQILRRLATRHDVTYVSLDDQVSGAEERRLAREYCGELLVVPHRRSPHFSPGFWWDLARNVLSPQPYFVMAYRSRPLRRALERLFAAGAHDAIVCDFPALSVNLPERIPIPSLLFEHNVEAEIWRRMAETEPRWPARRYLLGQWAKAVRFERDAVHRFDRVVAVSAVDAARLRDDYGLAQVPVIPTGVDPEFFRPAPTATERPHHLVFTGALDWLPNEEGMTWFLGDVLPRIRSELPDVTLTIAGRHPRPELRARVARMTGVTLTGRVDDIRPFLAEAAVVVVPLRIGGGTRLKIFEALAMERPVVSTRIGAEGLPLVDGRDLDLADSAEAFAAAVVRRLRNPKAARLLARDAGARVRRAYDWSGAADQFDQVLRDLAEGRSEMEMTPTGRRSNGGARRSRT